MAFVDPLYTQRNNIPYNYILLLYHTVGTHGIIGAEVSTTDDQHNTVIINIRYTVHSRARGTVLVFTPVESEAVQRSILLVLERNESHNHTLSLNSLPPAQYLVLVYEVNREGSLSSGVSYPAVVCELNASHFKKGTPQFFSLGTCFNKLGGQHKH